jgi:glycosyltransferase involved in cell wall biosynthesis
MEFAVNLALNQVSFGQVGMCILREMHKRGLSPHIFPISHVDVRNYKLESDFKEWLEAGINKSYTTHKRTSPTFKLWHIQNSLESLSHKQILFTFHECDTLTLAEINIVNNNDKVLFSSKYSKNVAENFGCTNVDNLPLGFDSTSFKVLNKEYLKDRITFGIGGKWEKRKNHPRILNLWAKKYGNKKEYALNCAVANPHLTPDVQEAFRRQALDGKKFYNINFLPFMENNEAFSDFLNSNNIFIGLSAAEGWGLPEFQSCALGKHIIALNATGYREWADKDNSILVNPTGKISLTDGIFFREGAPFAQGSGFTWTDEQFYEAIDKAIERFQTNPINEAGLLLQQKFTYSQTVDKIMDELNKL